MVVSARAKEEQIPDWVVIYWFRKIVDKDLTNELSWKEDLNLYQESSYRGFNIKILNMMIPVPDESIQQYQIIY